MYDHLSNDPDRNIIFFNRCDQALHLRREQLAHARHLGRTPINLMLENFDKNWGGNQIYNSRRIYFPQSLDRLQQIVKDSKNIKAIGSRHSFNNIADCHQDHVSLEMMKDIRIDHVKKTATVCGAINYGELSTTLDRAGFALHNLASLPHISVIGACSTGTHGSGDNNQSLASAVTAIEFVAADGVKHTLDKFKDPDIFPGAVVSLGALGVVTKITLAIVPTYEVKQYVYEDLPFSALEKHFDQVTSLAYSVSLFTDWKNENVNQVWIKSRVDESHNFEENLFGANAAKNKKHPAAGCNPDCCTEQGGVAGVWFERLPHFRMDFTPSVGKELQSEYIISRSNAIEAIKALNRISKLFTDKLIISEIRTVKADELWLSPFNRQNSVGIHFTWKADPTVSTTVLPKLEQTLSPYSARPHWGKLFEMGNKQLEVLYPDLPKFRELVQRYDPGGKFRNSFLNDKIFAGK